MPNWLDRLLPPPPKGQGRDSNMPMQRSDRAPMLDYGRQQPPITKGIPNAALIYGVASSMLAFMSVYLLLNGRWGTALVVMFPAICLFAFAYYLIRYSDT